MLGSVARLSQSSTGRKTRCTLIWNLLWEIKRQKCKLRCIWEATINRRWLRLRAYIHHQRRDLLRLVGRALQQLKAAVKRIEINRELRRGNGKMKKRMKSQPLSQASTTVLNLWLLSMAGQSVTKAARPKAHPSLMYQLHLKILNQQRIIWIAQALPQTLISTLTMHHSNSNSNSSSLPLASIWMIYFQAAVANSLHLSMLSKLVKSCLISTPRTNSLNNLRLMIHLICQV